MYMYSENFARKGPDEVISCLDHYIRTEQRPTDKKLVIFCDNCYSQNKNKFLVGILDGLCSKGVFETVTVFYPIPGHSFMPIDRDFAKIEQACRNVEVCELPDNWVRLV